MPVFADRFWQLLILDLHVLKVPPLFEVSASVGGRLVSAQLAKCPRRVSGGLQKVRMAKLDSLAHIAMF